MMINQTSVQPYHHKIAAFNSMTHKLIPLEQTPENFSRQLLRIKQVPFNNRYGVDLIDNVLNKQMYKKQFIVCTLNH